MKGIDKLSYSRLATVLAQEGMVPSDVLNELLRESNEKGALLPEILVRDGFLSEWDLAKVVSQEFSLPILHPSHYQIDKEVLARFPAELIRKTKVLPIDSFGGIITVAMPLLAPHATLQEIAAKVKAEVFPYVSLLTEVKKVIDEKFPEPKAPLSQTDAGGWEKLFDEADQQIQKETGKP